MSVIAGKVAGPPPAAMRARHLASLQEPQELFLERRVTHGSTWLIEQNDAPAGYAVVEDGGKLLELFYDDSLEPGLAELFSTLTAAANIKSCLYQSFDPGMEKLAAAVRAQVEPIGILFRTVLNPHHQARQDVSMRPATETDLPAIAGINDGFFADKNEVRRYLDVGRLWVLQSSATGIIGCGVAAPVFPNGTDIDIGMLVAPGFRRRGYGTFIVSHLKSHVLSKGQRPICGCGIKNVGSQRAIESAGFAPDHRLLSFRV